VPPPRHDLPAHKRLFHNLAFGCARKYFQVVYTLAPFSPTPTSFDTTLVLFALHLESDGFLPLFLKNYELDQYLKLSSDFFKLAF